MVKPFRDFPLGDGPIVAKYRKMMNDLAALLDRRFNGHNKGKDREVGFVLLVFPFGEQEGRCNYISNGADRRDMVKLLREQADRFEISIAQAEKEGKPIQ